MEEEIKKILKIVSNHQYVLDEILNTVTNLKLKTPTKETPDQNFERRLAAAEELVKDYENA